MIRLVWLDRFMAFLCLVLVLFIVTMGWLISSEKQLNDSFSADKAQENQTRQNVHTFKQPAVKAYHPAPASSGNARRMYEYVETAADDNADGILNVSAASGRQAENTGYQWAASHQITQLADCNVLSSAYINGCRSYVEVSQYVNQAKPSFSL